MAENNVKNEKLVATPETWDKVAETYSVELEEGDLQLASDIEGILKNHGLQKGDSLIEMGCGSGHLSLCLAQKGYKVTLVDFSSVALEKAKLTFKRYGVEGEFILGDLFNLDENLPVCDYAWNSGVMEHFGDDEIITLMKNIGKHAKRGVLYLVPNSNSIAYLLMRARLMADDEWIYGEEYLRRDYEEILQVMGYKNIEKSYVTTAAISSYQMWKAEKEQANISELYRNLAEEKLLPEKEGYLVSYYASNAADIVEKVKYRGSTVRDTKVFDSVAKRIGYNELKREIDNLQGQLSKLQHQSTYLMNSNVNIKDTEKFFLNLFGQKETYRYFLTYMLENIDEFSDSVEKSLTEDELMELLTCLLIVIGRNGFKNAERKRKLFYKAEALGMHLVLAHFYNPIPILGELQPLKADYHKQLISLEYNDDKFFDLLESLSSFKEEISDIPNVSDKIEYYYENNAFGGIDAIMYYYMIRYFKPCKLIEVGAGYSTLIAARACKKNGNTEFISIEPYPMDFVQRGIDGLNELKVEKLQEIPLSFFEQLEENDILFIDSSHVLKAGSDVTYIFTTILPRLKKGVIIHFHDMFIPYELPEKWTREELLFWNEQYVLYSLLINAKEEYETIMPNYYLGSNYRERLISYFPTMPELKIYDDVSYWIRKK